MIGRFTTRCYDSRADYIAGRASAIHDSFNSFTDAGLQWMWEMMAGNLRNEDGTVRDHLASARLVIGNGTREFAPSDERMAGQETAQAELRGGFPAISIASDEGLGVIRFEAVFTEDQGVFEWQERGVVTAQGVLLDRAVGDQGRKPLGAVWELGAELQIGR